MAHRQGASDGRSNRAQVTRAKIVSAATHLFGTRGVSASSMDDIAAAAGIAKGSIYNSFGSKDELVAQLIREENAALDERLREDARDRSGAAERRAIVAGLLQAIAEMPDTTRFIVSELFRTSRDWADATQDWRAVTAGPLERSLRTEFPHLDAEQASVQAAGILGATLVAALDWLVNHPERSYETVLTGILTVTGLTAAPRSEPA
ncbi:TetR/AcrR family transcriptional regulator [Nigerium massiliense]|uniref:TetR/AcrR family transcriptional regulator n=1 Tax=Nigerium massiliense TaxID=1522317 RepID=UPI000694C586|nr:TetR/AcrR family transcriptional regulator [Nigerium massiliense]